MLEIAQRLLHTKCLKLTGKTKHGRSPTTDL